ncbi:LOW QUALITY PROTEIN: annexin-2 receptor-like [Mus pahari]|uniref:LOW QUALITY PROTEIN: annexin-2 receptor-like n=1 Tax=Mus pahari TaxID=10093 RepID=UPI000A305818|nr:LOW QUALITY PROTEIN: annexin-2 receptor-like [Mus pahari]
MESTFRSVQVKQVWDSVPPVREAQPPLLPSFSEDHGPWPLPFYPVLGPFPSHRGDYQEQPLPVWIGDFAEIYPTTYSYGIQSTSESSTPDSVTTVYQEQREKTATPRTRGDAAEESFTVAMQPGSCSRAPHRGDDAKGTETSGGSSFTEIGNQPGEAGEVDSGLCQDSSGAFLAR